MKVQNIKTGKLMEVRNSLGRALIKMGRAKAVDETIAAPEPKSNLAPKAMTETRMGANTTRQPEPAPKNDVLEPKSDQTAPVVAAESEAPPTPIPASAKDHEVKTMGAETLNPDEDDPKNGRRRYRRRDLTADKA